MHAVFGASYSAARKQALAAMPQMDNRARTGNFIITPLATSQLPGGEMVLVTESHIPLAPGEPEPHHNDVSGLINVYVLNNANGKWRVLQRHESLVYRGYGNRPGSILFPMLAAGRQGLAVMHASLDEGCWSETLHLYDLSQQQLHDLANIPTGHAENAGCGTDTGYAEERTDSTWQLLAPARQASSYKDIMLTMTAQKTPYDRESEAPEEPAGPPAVMEQITVRYAFDGKRYQPVAGTNPLKYAYGG